jgi:hypothetical protein
LLFAALPKFCPALDVKDVYLQKNKTMRNIATKYFRCFLAAFAFIASQQPVISQPELNSADYSIAFSGSAAPGNLKHWHSGGSSFVYRTAPIKIQLAEFGSFISAGAIIGYADSCAATAARLRHSADTAGWSSWQELPAMDLHQPEAGIYRSELVFIEPSNRYVQLELSMGTIGEAGIQQCIQHLSIRFSSPLQKKKPVPDHAAPSALKNDNRPHYINRAGWGCPQAENTAERELTELTHIVLHHSAGASNAKDYPAVVLSYWDYHVNANGWDDIGYNWLIDPSGIIYKGRAWYNDTIENVKGAHNSGKNSGTSGICFIGSYTGGLFPPKPQWESAFSIAAFICGKFGLDPRGYASHQAIGRDNNVITGHRHSGGGTLCPANIADYYETFRDETALRMGLQAEPGPYNLAAEVKGCGKTDINFTWENTGSPWRIIIAGNPEFTGAYVKWVSGANSFQGPGGFMLMPDEVLPLQSLQAAKTYSWKIEYGQRSSTAYQFHYPGCGLNYAKPESASGIIYPAAARGWYYYHAASGNTSLEIRDLLGNQVYYIEAFQNQASFYLGDLPNGMYFAIEAAPGAFYASSFIIGAN